MDESMVSRKVYYRVKPLVPRRVQLLMRRLWTRRMMPRYEHVWPVNEQAARPPADWRGWPQGRQFALILTHDVDTRRGRDRCEDLMRLEESLGFRSSFYLVPERYSIPADLRESLTSRGFEVGVHGLNHDGRLYESRDLFDRRAARINMYLKQWGCTGFRSPAMHSNLGWLGCLDIRYDASTFDTDPFEPQPQGTDTIFPFFVPRDKGRSDYVELPYTLPQDFTLFVLMKQADISIWKRKLDWVAARGGMALLITHPDYMTFDGRPTFDTYPADYYAQFLRYVKDRYEGLYWPALAADMARFWSESRMPVQD